MTSTRSRGPTVAIVGGGLAGLATAVALAGDTTGQPDGPACQVELFEARRQLGGRAGSFRDGATGELVDLCQHVSMGCCDELAQFCQRTGIDRFFQRHPRLHFFDPAGRRHDLEATPWLPAPLHLAPALLRLGFLSWRERWSLSRAILKLARTPAAPSDNEPSIGRWLTSVGQSERLIGRFWSVVLVSALSESLGSTALSAARKVIADGFLASTTAYHILTPTVPLSELYDHVSDWLTQHGVAVHRETPIERVDGDATGARGVLVAGESRARPFDHVVLAVPWRRLASLVGPELFAATPELAMAGRLESAAITAVHLWFDRPIMDLPHAVVLERLSQWVFARGSRPGPDGSPRYYYQVVISAAHAMQDRDRDQVRDQVLADLRAIWPATAEARLEHTRIVTERDAVFSPRPGSASLRPRQRTRIPGLLLAGDWTATGWPATMESAVRSGNLAAQALRETAARVP